MRGNGQCMTFAAKNCSRDIDTQSRAAANNDAQQKKRKEEEEEEERRRRRRDPCYFILYTMKIVTMT